MVAESTTRRLRTAIDSLYAHAPDGQHTDRDIWLLAGVSKPTFYRAMRDADDQPSTLAIELAVRRKTAAPTPAVAPPADELGQLRRANGQLKQTVVELVAVIHDHERTIEKLTAQLPNVIALPRPDPPTNEADS